jgi:DNA-binding GntR family transcriptional regulator
MVSPVKPSTASEAATTALFEAICDGTIPPGTHLRLQELSDQLGMSMMPVREAIRQLAAMELVDLEPHKGARVRPMTLEDLRDTYEARFVVEGAAVRQAAGAFTATDAEVARQALADRARHLESGERRLARDAHERFHFTLYEAAGNPWLVRSILPLWRNAERYRLESFRHPEVLAQRACEHEEILAAVVAGDGDTAERRMIEHLTASMRLVEQSLPTGAGVAAVR